MLVALDDAAQASAGPSTSSAVSPSLVVCERIKTGKRGRPRVEIDPTFLEVALDLRGPTKLGKVFGCNSRTVRRRALEHGLALPGTPVRTETIAPDGSTTVTYSSSSRPVSTMSDAQLDDAIRRILQVFPKFGNRMISGRLKAEGHNVPRARIKAARIRVQGAPASFGTRQRIIRRTYYVPGPLSLVHHDGQHGM